MSAITRCNLHAPCRYPTGMWIFTLRGKREPDRKPGVKSDGGGGRWETGSDDQSRVRQAGGAGDPADPPTDRGDGRVLPLVSVAAKALQAGDTIDLRGFGRF